MTFSLHAFLPDDVAPMTNASLADDLESCFSHDDRFVLEVERLPFSDNDTLALRWDSWMARVSYEEGDEVIADVVAIQAMAPASPANEMAAFSRRIRVVFGSDDDREHTNEIVLIMVFLQKRSGKFVYDPQQNDFLP